jgi:tetratricopeptide (TPR) repeat protein
MTPTNPQHNDGKTLLAVSALVVAGAIGIAVLASLSLRHDQVAEAETDEPRYAPAQTRSERPAPSITPATFEPVVETTPEPEVVEPAFEIDPDENLIARGLQLYESREFDRAAAYFAAEVEARPGGAWTRYMLGLSLWKSGAHEQAEAAMQAAADADPTSVRSFVNLSRIRNDLGRHEEALAAARSALELDGESAGALFLEGRTLMNLGLFEEAITSLEASLEREPDNGYVRNMLGLTLIRRGTPYEAVKHLERAVELIPEVAFVHNNLGMALERSGNRTGAFLAYQAGAGVDPTHAKVVANFERLQPIVGELPVVPVEQEAIAENEVPAVEPGEDSAEPTLVAEIQEGEQLP